MGLQTRRQTGRLPASELLQLAGGDSIRQAYMPDSVWNALLEESNRTHGLLCPAHFMRVAIVTEAVRGGLIEPGTFDPLHVNEHIRHGSAIVKKQGLESVRTRRIRISDPLYELIVSMATREGISPSRWLGLALVRRYTTPCTPS